MYEFSALAEIIERNRKYSPEQEERVKQEPLGDWQSPSDNARWDALHMRLCGFGPKALRPQGP